MPFYREMGCTDLFSAVSFPSPSPLVAFHPQVIDSHPDEENLSTSLLRSLDLRLPQRYRTPLQTQSCVLVANHLLTLPHR